LRSSHKHACRENPDPQYAASGKKKQQPLFKALADETTLASVRALHEEGIPALNASSVPRDELTAQKAELYTKLADLNREIRQIRKELKLCQEILAEAPGMEQEIQRMEGRKREQVWQR
jgi:DNA-binding transcriptional regulator YiaG